MEQTSLQFRENAARALSDPQLQRALRNVKTGFILKRAAARAALPEFDALRDEAAAIKTHVIDHLDIYLEEYERRVLASGGHVHWASDAAEARDIVLSICREAGAKTVTKGKSMVSEEIGLNAALEAADIRPVETDLGEYIIQLRRETPSHIIAPAVHLNRDQIEGDFRVAHAHLPPERDLSAIPELVGEARTVLRQQFLAADVGITGANFLIAETGSSVIVTNEGNGDLTQLLPRTHIVIASLEKLVPTLEDASTLLRVLARSATGQEMTSYTTFSTGPRRDEDPDGPDAYHVVLLDNGRSDMLGTDFQDMLRCIRCGACLNHCPVYAAVGGHAYGSVYPGPMGAVLTPQLMGIHDAAHLPNASTFCGRCQAVCPVHIPLPNMMRRWRERYFASQSALAAPKLALRAWAFFAKRAGLYRFATAAQGRLLSLFPRSMLARLPLAKGWTAFRVPPKPASRPFLAQWHAREQEKARLGRLRHG
ncbi:iron-sulfur cluster-binding protein [Rhodomicrobium sp. Az07]|uniref:LutB/LldF family L-lactate oxidation iron-sulfur protein n=1 Tax=Rhodomicrobium sp. Az07 TaxID=2839034 RepID=UPI001BEC8939|nr:LutB/LldF family L-lactate oxidation iron-sulfur protein [Rhodomicrobium sp. Az07]MBT3070624.1 iron-sulfur cluster-binding protein [Rhodomicrobium sp. Az07]